MTSRFISALFLSSALCALATAARADDQPHPAAPPAKTEDSLGLDEVVVTATSTKHTKLETSISVSTLDPDRILESAPSSAADILREIPGLRSEASGGEGNANISARGLPLAAGGAKYVQLQEDGLPVLQFGDIDFATPDTFMRFDYTIANVEAVRGGSTSTFASGAPGAVINFISKTGETDGGAVGITRGLDYDETRFDFDYGGHISDTWRFHIGGFYRDGEGPRTADFTAEEGGQIRGNITHDFDNGYIRLNFKYLNDKSPAYLPNPIQITGNPLSPSVSSVPGFNAQSGTLLSPYFPVDSSFNSTGARVSTSLSDGYHPESGSFGGEAHFDLKEGITLDDNFRVSFNSGDFVGTYPATVDKASSLATAIGGAGATLSYATGPLAGRTIANPASLNGNGQAVQVTLFNTTLNDLGNFVNDLKLSKDFDIAELGKLHVLAGYFHSNQSIVEDWHWNSYLEEAAGKDAALLNVSNSSGKLVTLNGLVGYNAGFGYCCVRYYDLRYTTDAPYASATLDIGKFNLDGSLRYDVASASGSYSGGGALQQIATGNAAVPSLPGVLNDPSSALPVNYTKRYLSYSFGANYLLDPDLAVFARVSQGGHANAERILFGSGVLADGSAAQDSVVDMVQQYEGGVKWKTHDFSVFATGFYASTHETNFDVTTDTATDAQYHAYGLELETSVHYEGFRISGGATYTHMRIASDAANPANVGHVPQRQAEFVYQITPGYYAEDYNLGVNIIGTTDSYASDADNLVQPGYTSVNLFANYFVTENLRASFNVNNLFDVIGITEIDSSPNASGVATARTINGRTMKFGLQYTF